MTQIAEKYAKALFMAASDSAELVDVREAFALWIDGLRDARGVHPRHPLLKGLLSSVLKRDRGPFISEIFEKYSKMCDDAQRRSKAEITTAFPMDPEHRVALLKTLSRLSGSNIELDEKLDSSLIGGAVVRIGDNVFDFSLSKRLSMLRKELAG